MRSISILAIIFVGVFSIIGKASAPKTSVLESEFPDEEDDLDVHVRENPIIEISDTDFNLEVPDFIAQNLNNVDLNGANWASMTMRLGNLKKMPFTIVHIGDSHSQADISTKTVRDMLQYDFGNAGRGLVIPFKMASTNQPWDYTITSRNGWKSSKLLKRPWSLPMGFTGVALKPINNSSQLTIATSENDDYNPFTSVAVFCRGDFNIKSVTDGEGNPIEYAVKKIIGGVQLNLGVETNRISVEFDSSNLVLYGFNLSGNRPGIFYHVIGNNGATFSSYNSVAGFSSEIRHLLPDLIIVQLGTNEAFAYEFDENSFIVSVGKLISSLKAENPSAEILLVTPMECQKSRYTTSYKKIKTKHRHGKSKKRSRTVTKNIAVRNRSYVPNSNVLQVRNAILKYARQNKIAVYDFYAIAGGENASGTWFKSGLLGSDRVHFTSKGYHLQGMLFYDALRRALTNN